MRRNWFDSGKYNAICRLCGFKRKNVDLVERWDGLMVCAPHVVEGCWEPRHPQELIRPIPEQFRLPWTSPEPKDQFINVSYLASAFTCSVVGQLCIADYATADCAIVGNIVPPL